MVLFSHCHVAPHLYEPAVHIIYVELYSPVQALHSVYCCMKLSPQWPCVIQACQFSQQYLTVFAALLSLALLSFDTCKITEPGAVL